jgi:hypothetical protein
MHELYMIEEAHSRSLASTYCKILLIAEAFCRKLSTEAFLYSRYVIFQYVPATSTIAAAGIRADHGNL